MKKGIIILGHGSRAPEAAQTVAAVTTMVSEQIACDRVVYASLQLSEPSLAAAVEELSAAGLERILVMPLLIAPGQHVKEDIPNELAALGERYPHLDLRLGAPLGADPRLAAIVVDRVKELEDVS